MNNSIIFYDSSSKLINPSDDGFNSKKLAKIFLDDAKNIDENLTEIIRNELSTTTYINILIPICFGKTLSDFLGLRFACHIRSTPSLNQCANIYLYSFTSINDFLSNQCFNIIKTEGVFVIDYEVETILKCCNVEKTHLLKENIIRETKRLNLEVPSNYEDNHSISNEWAIYRWSQIIGASDDGIEGVNNIQNNNLYFKYLKTISPISTQEKLTSEEIKIKYKGNPKVLYIDDEAEKGWYEIFCEILADENNIDFQYLDDEFIEKTRDKIVEISLNKIKKEGFEIVILDLRLHKDDFENSSIQEITGYQILKKIKEYNKGIQVVIFSATNKIWNLQALQMIGSDGFIIKESFENNGDLEFTRLTVTNFSKTIETCISKIFLKKIYSILSPLIERIESNISKKPKNYNLKIQQDKLLNYLEYFKSADLLLSLNSNNLSYCFLQLILVIEDIIKGFYIESSDKKQYVDISIYERILCLEKSMDQIKLMLKPIEGLNKFIEEEFILYEGDAKFKLFNNQGDRIPFNYRLNSVLYFKYKIGLDQSSKYSSLYKVRSKSVAHMGGAKVKEIDILNSLELLSILIQ